MIEQEQVNAAIAALEQAKDQPPVKSYATQKEAVASMRENIIELHKRGWSVAAIAKVITDAGVKTSPAVVGSVLKPRKRKPRKSRAKQDEQNTETMRLPG
ncbi:hypothetical protein HF673_01085 [Acidithiobacillus thiooxidans]|uniref:hypothetical protein n=1 Tax=Acidithiobacillus thiooxidans TaxID=930 RepID=UPI001C06DD9F|nr:hypothetical protein [Acidithiobacillus thiooxidans]MBU2834409.1 hypothetical protein [Acidithiobacillus thiooxidans]